MKPFNPERAALLAGSASVETQERGGRIAEVETNRTSRLKARTARHLCVLLEKTVCRRRLSGAGFKSGLAKLLLNLETAPCRPRRGRGPYAARRRRIIMAKLISRRMPSSSQSSALRWRAASRYAAANRQLRIVSILFTSKSPYALRRRGLGNQQASTSVETNNMLFAAASRNVCVLMKTLAASRGALGALASA
jgi:hypothetical protein